MNLNFIMIHMTQKVQKKIIDNQKKIVEYQKKQKDTKNVFQILIIVDDHADDPAFSRNSKLLHSLFTRGRHSGISTIVSTQKFAAIHPIIRVNATELIVFRLRNYQDTQMFIDELGGLVDKKHYQKYIKLLQNNRIVSYMCV